MYNNKIIALAYYIFLPAHKDYYRPFFSSSELALLTTVKIPKNGKTDCSWVPVVEVVASGNRIYVYGIYKTVSQWFILQWRIAALQLNWWVCISVQDSEGLVAVDMMADEPYYKKAWELADDSLQSSYNLRKDNSKDQCVVIPPMDSDYAWFPPG